MSSRQKAVGAVVTVTADRVVGRTGRSTTRPTGGGTSTRHKFGTRSTSSSASPSYSNTSRPIPTDCGETDPVVLEFDHLRDKEFDIASGIHYHAWSKVLAEIAKCEVVCANCHRRRTARRRGALRLILSEAPG